MDRKSLISTQTVFAIYVGLTQASLPGQIPWPEGVSARQQFHVPDALADPQTGSKPGWTNPPGVDLQPRKRWWEANEVDVYQRDNGQWVMIAMEKNRVYGYAEALNFVTLNSDFPTTPTTPQAENGYWRGGHPYVWAPMTIRHEGLYLMYYTALWEEAPGDMRRSCFLATSQTGAPSPEAWTRYDPDPNTPAIEPLITGISGSGFRDFHVTIAPGPNGPLYYNYYIANPFSEEHGVEISEVRLRISDDPYHFPDITELPDPVFRKVNVGGTIFYRYFVDYESPSVIRYDDNNWFLLVSRHGVYPADLQTNPDFEIIRHATEVYWSSDGKNFSRQGPELLDSEGRYVNSAAIFQHEGEWWATHSAFSNDITTYPMNCCPNDDGELTDWTISEHRYAATHEDPLSNVQVLKLGFRPRTGNIIFGQ